MNIGGLTRWNLLWILVITLMGWRALEVQASEADSRILANADGSQLQTWVDQVQIDSLRPVWIQACVLNGTPRFAAIAARDFRPLAWKMRHHLKVEDFQIEFDKNFYDGFQLLSLTEYVKEGQDHVAAIWVKHGLGGKFEAFLRLSPEEYRLRLRLATKAQMLPFSVTMYQAVNGVWYSPIFTAQPGMTVQSRDNLSESDFRKVQTEQAAKFLRPRSLSVLATEKGIRYSAVFVRDGYDGETRLGVSEEELPEVVENRRQAGFQPIALAGYVDRGKLRHAVCFQYSVPAEPSPSGELPKQFEAIDAAIRDFQHEHRIPCGSLAIGKDRQILLTRGYGYATRDRTRAVQPHDLFRIASVSKPITAALVHHLARDGKLDLEAAAFPYIGAKPLPGQMMDPHLNQITIQHLLRHQGGWIREKTFDPMFRPDMIARELHRPAPATANDVIQYMMGQPLQFTPGQHQGSAGQRYSNFGYCVLGRVIEKATGRPYFESLKDRILDPLGIQEIQLGRTLPENRHRSEPYYSDSGVTQNVFEAEQGDLVYWPDGGFHLEAMDAHGGLIASAPDLVKFFQHYWVSGEPRAEDDRPQDWTSTGSLDGTASLVRQIEGFDVAVLFNQRISTDDSVELRARIDDAVRNLPAE